ncbi:hypothetical protein Lal_00035508 [Lupinus albus]|nr:hypothetical protein Lal_00035508 [Lupinus albus]
MCLGFLIYFKLVGFSLKRAHSRSSEGTLAQARQLSLKRGSSRSSEDLTASTGPKCHFSRPGETTLAQARPLSLKRGNSRPCENPSVYPGFHPPRVSHGCVEVDNPEELLIFHFDIPIEAIVYSTYLDLHLHYNDEKFLQRRAIIASTIDIVDQINEYVLSIIPGEEKDYLSSDSVDMSDINYIETVNILTTKFLNTLSTSGLPNHKIKLKVGTPIMLLRNLDQSEG